MVVLLLIGFAFILAAARGTAVYEAFIRGAKEGLRTAATVAPYLAAALFLCAMLRESGFAAWLSDRLESLFGVFCLPKELTQLLIIRPLSGAAALSELEQVLRTYGPDSYLARTACCLLGSSETVLYTIALYLGTIGVKKSRYILPIALISGWIGAISGAFLCKFL